MSIAPVNTVTHAASTFSPASPTQKVQTPEQTEIDKFNQIMFGTTSNTPEQRIMNVVTDHHQTMVADLSSVSDIAQGGVSPKNFLTLQEKLMRSSIGIDFGAKVAGQLSQAVNKLVSMQ